MKHLLLDVNIVIDACIERENSIESIAAIAKAKSLNINIWLYTGSVQTLEYVLAEEIIKQQNNKNQTISKGTALRESRNTLKLFSENFSWLSSLSNEGNVFTSEDPEDEQLLLSLDRFPKNTAKIITNNKKLLKRSHKNTISPKTFLQKEISTPSIDFANLHIQQDIIRPELEKSIHSVLHHGKYIMGPEVAELEDELQKFTGAKHAITCSSGTDALLLAMMAMDIQPGDEIITTPFTFIATAETIALMKAKPVFVDIEEDTYNIDATKIEAVITDKTKAIMPVSLYGQPADMDVIQAIADKHKLKIIIDGAQSFGSSYKGKTDSNLGDISTTSFFPAKPLGCYGDGGAVFTNNDQYAEKMRMMRVHGQNKRYHHKYIGIGGRLDTLQAAILLSKLTCYEKEIEMRQKIARSYTKDLDNSLIKPITKEKRTSVWAQYTVRVKNRDQIQEKLKESGIPTAVHYPMPLHLQECFQYLGYQKGSFPVAEKVSKEVLSLPMNPFLSVEEISYISSEISS